MGQISKFLRSQANGGLLYWCQGCNEAHAVHVTTGHYTSSHKPGDYCWCTYNAEHPDDATHHCQRCHTFITDGKVQFLSDCTHSLAGQTLDLPELPAHLQDQPA